jgi:hypothetical protein
MGEHVNLLVSIKLSDEYLSEYVGMSPEDIGYNFIEELAYDYVDAGVEFEILEII